MERLYEQKPIIEYFTTLRAEAAREFEEAIERANGRKPRAIAIDEIQTNNSNKTVASTHAAEANIRYVNRLKERGLG